MFLSGRESSCESTVCVVGSSQYGRTVRLFPLDISHIQWLSLRREGLARKTVPGMRVNGHFGWDNKTAPGSGPGTHTTADGDRWRGLRRRLHFRRLPTVRVLLRPSGGPHDHADSGLRSYGRGGRNGRRALSETVEVRLV